jgi:hypothetical protein
VRGFIISNRSAKYKGGFLFYSLGSLQKFRFVVFFVHVQPMQRGRIVEIINSEMVKLPPSVTDGSQRAQVIWGDVGYTMWAARLGSEYFVPVSVSGRLNDGTTVSVQLQDEVVTTPAAQGLHLPTKLRGRVEKIVVHRRPSTLKDRLVIVSIGMFKKRLRVRLCDVAVVRRPIMELGPDTV